MISFVNCSQKTEELSDYEKEDVVDSAATDAVYSLRGADAPETPVG